MKNTQSIRPRTRSQRRSPRGLPSSSSGPISPSCRERSNCEHESPSFFNEQSIIFNAKFMTFNAKLDTCRETAGTESSKNRTPTPWFQQNSLTFQHENQGGIPHFGAKLHWLWLIFIDCYWVSGKIRRKSQILVHISIDFHRSSGEIVEILAK